MLAVGLAFAATVGIIIIFFGINQVLTANPDVGERLAVLTRREKALGKQEKGEKSEGVITVAVDKAIAKQSFAQNISRDLARANLKLTVTEYLMINIATTVLGAIIGNVIGQSIIIAIAFGVVGFFLPRWYVSNRKGARLKAFNGQLNDTIALLANSLRSGYSLLQAMDMVAREAAAPTSEEFSRVVREVGLGLSPEEALQNLVRRIASDDLDLMVTAIKVQHEVGGNLSQILETIGHTIRERVRIKGEISSLTAQQQYGGYVISALPIFTTLFMYMLNKEYILPLFEGIYICIPIAGVTMIVIGSLIIKKITSIEV